MNDDAFDRLRAADPAHDASEPAAGVLRAKVDALIGTDTPTGTAGAAPGGDPSSGRAGTDELARRRPRGRQPWLVAAAVAGFVAIGGGGYAAGANGLLAAGGGDSTGGAESATVADAAPPITLDQGGDDAAGDSAEGLAGTESAEEVAPDVQEEVGREPAVGSFMYPAPSHTVFHAGAGLSDDAGELAAYTLDAQASFTRETAESAARALGLRGEVRQEGGAWVVGPDDGSGASLRIAADGTTSIWFNDVWPDSWRCDVVEPGLPDDPTGDDGAAGTGQGSSGAADPGGATVPEGGVDSKDGFAPPCLEDDAGAPSDAEARDELRRVMEALDVDVDAFDFTTDARGMGTSVTAFHRIDGRRTGLQWSATLSGASDTRIVSLNGFLAPVTELGTYPVVSEREAVERLGDARFGATPGDVRPLAAATGPEDGSAPTGPPASLEPGAPIAWPVRDVTITSARLGVAQHVLTDGAVVLIPAYELTGAGGTWSVVAVSEDLLDFAGR
ncbi:hypothetical protein [Myceligenerans pegani]|uniref:Uncharacterized protein n=1 Tax=Myceligenerans pegani TaxID=2776917 RepID=A0ABR9MUR7_9MICO|nr:hypothetical protein [Myceligenerans sp. TRM 65318]MBE1875135.1 hypothetical protein [Myceligenerans sp. TRM 65318]MBE3017406.1 hypothetical protein [Myceligenerans sp. TRM 65318]